MFYVNLITIFNSREDVPGIKPYFSSPFNISRHEYIYRNVISIAEQLLWTYLERHVQQNSSQRGPNMKGPGTFWEWAVMVTTYFLTVIIQILDTQMMNSSYLQSDLQDRFRREEKNGSDLYFLI